MSFADHDCGGVGVAETMRDMIEASAARRPAMPRTRRRGSTTACSSAPIAQVPTPWKMP